MSKFTKISALALFSLFLTACDKPADKPATAAAKPEAAQVEQNTGAADFKKYQSWQSEQERLLNEAMHEVMAQSKGDEKATQAAMAKVVAERLEHIRQAAQTLDIRDPEVNALKDKALEVMALGVQMLNESEKAGNDPEAQKALIALTQQLQKTAEEGAMIETALQQKYGAPAPAAVQPQPQPQPASATEAPALPAEQAAPAQPAQ